MNLSNDINIVLIGKDNISIGYGEPYQEYGAVAKHDPSDTMLNVKIIDTVDPNLLGVQEVTYRAEFGSDYNEIKRSVLVKAIVPPRIIFKDGFGPESPWLHQTPITEDDVRGFVIATNGSGDDITPNIKMLYYDPSTNTEVTLGFLDTDTINSRIRVVYQVADSDGNYAIPLECTIKVAPVEETILALSGTSEINLEVYEAFLEPGYSAIDALGADITHQVLVTVDGQNISLVQDTLTDQPGIKIVKYNVTDQWGRHYEEERILNIASDKHPKLILFSDNIEIDRNYYVNESFFRPLVSVLDYVDGHKLSNEIEIDIKGLDVFQHGEYEVKFNVTNSIGLSAPEEIMKVLVINKTEAIHRLELGATDRTIDYDETYTKDRLLSGVTFRDYKDNLIPSEDIEVDMRDINLKGPGEYQLYYRAMDYTGLNTRWIEATVLKTNTAQPVIINATPTEVIGVNAIYTKSDALNGVNGLTYDGIDISDHLAADIDSLDTSTVGIYDVTYTLINPVNNVHADSETRSVEVTDPAGSMLYNNIEVLMVPVNTDISGLDMTEGIAAIDGQGSNLPLDNLVVNENIDMAVPGEYDITYSMSMGDYQLNPVIRKFIVTDEIDPMKFVTYDVGENQDGVSIYKSENGIDYTKME